MEIEEIPPELVINWNQTGIHYVPVSSCTMAKVGSKQVEITGIDDKRQTTAVFGGSMAGDYFTLTGDIPRENLQTPSICYLPS